MLDDGELSISDKVEILHHFKRFDDALTYIESTMKNVERDNPSELANNLNIIKLLYYKIRISRIKKLDDIETLNSLFREIESFLSSSMLFDYYYLATDLFRRGELHLGLRYFQKLEELYLKTSEESYKYEENTAKYNFLLGSLYDPLAMNNLTRVDENRYSNDQLFEFLKRADHKARDNIILRVQILTQLSSYHHFRMNYDEEVELRSKLIELEKELVKKIDHTVHDYFGSKISQLADIAQELGDLDKFRLYSYEAIQHYEKALNDKNAELEKQMTNSAAIGRIYYKIGNLNRAITSTSAALEVAWELGNQQAYATYSENMARYQLILGNYDEAVELLHTLLRINEMLQSQNLARSTKIMLGSVYERVGQLSLALDYYEDAFSDSQHSHSLIRKIVEVAHKSGKNNIANGYLTILKERTKKSSNPFLMSSYQLAKAFILKDSIHDKVEVKNVLIKLLDSQQKSFYYTVLATKFLCEILLYEVQQSKDESIFTEIKKRVNNLHKAIGMDRSGLLIYDILILQSKLAFIEGDLDQTETYLEEALNIAKENGHTHIISTIQQEKEKIDGKIKNWGEIIEKNLSLIDRIENSNLEKYLNFEISIFEIDL